MPIAQHAADNHLRQEYKTIKLKTDLNAKLIFWWKEQNQKYGPLLRWYTRPSTRFCEVFLWFAVNCDFNLNLTWKSLPKRWLNKCNFFLLIIQVVTSHRHHCYQGKSHNIVDPMTRSTESVCLFLPAVWSERHPFQILKLSNEELCKKEGTRARGNSGDFVVVM